MSFVRAPGATPRVPTRRKGRTWRPFRSYVVSVVGYGSVSW
jgi:hypothetical protein